MVNASGVEAAQRDRGEARRDGVISRPFRRLCVFVRITISESAMGNLHPCNLCLLFSGCTWKKFVTVKRVRSALHEQTRRLVTIIADWEEIISRKLYPRSKFAMLVTNQAPCGKEPEQIDPIGGLSL
jgi:hypothetical protein